MQLNRKLNHHHEIAPDRRPKLPVSPRSVPLSLCTQPRRRPCHQPGCRRHDALSIAQKRLGRLRSGQISMPQACDRLRV